MTWQPIETAPRNEDFLGYFSNGEMHVVGIDDDGECYREMDKEKWELPERWMPLPPEPESLALRHRHRLT